MTTYELCKGIRRMIVNQAAECMNYTNWSAEFVKDEMLRIIDNVKGSTQYVPIQPAELTLSEMEDLGFGQLGEHSTDRLIPLWLFPFLADEIKCSVLDESAGMMKKSDMDNDHRYGCLAYGVFPKDLFVRAVEEVINSK